MLPARKHYRTSHKHYKTLFENKNLLSVLSPYLSFADKNSLQRIDKQTTKTLQEMKDIKDLLNLTSKELLTRCQNNVAMTLRIMKYPQLLKKLTFNDLVNLSMEDINVAEAYVDLPPSFLKFLIRREAKMKISEDEVTRCFNNGLQSILLNVKNIPNNSKLKQVQIDLLHSNYKNFEEEAIRFERNCRKLNSCIIL